MDIRRAIVIKTFTINYNIKMDYFLNQHCQNDSYLVDSSLRYLTDFLAIQDTKIDNTHLENEELVPSFNFKVYKIDIDRRLKKRYGKRLIKEHIIHNSTDSGILAEENQP